MTTEPIHQVAQMLLTFLDDASRAWRSTWVTQKKILLKLIISFIYRGSVKMGLKRHWTSEKKEIKCFSWIDKPLHGVMNTEEEGKNIVQRPNDSFEKKKSFYCLSREDIVPPLFWVMDDRDRKKRWRSFTKAWRSSIYHLPIVAAPSVSSRPGANEFQFDKKQLRCFRSKKK